MRSTYIVTALAILLLAAPTNATADATFSAATMDDAARAIAGSPTPIVISYVMSDRSTAFHAIAANSHTILILNGVDARDFEGTIPTNTYTSTSTVVRDNNTIRDELAPTRVYVALTKIPSHIKAADTALGLYLTDRNFVKAAIVVLDRNPADERAFQMAVKDGGYAMNNPDRSTPALALRKDTAVAREAALLRSAPGPIEMSTESFGDGTPVYQALLHHARGSRIIIAASEYRETPRERDAVARLTAAGATIRLSRLDEKLLITDSADFTGSANASPGAEHQLEWGIITTDPSIRAEITRRWNAVWDASTPLSSPL